MNIQKMDVLLEINGSFGTILANISFLFLLVSLIFYWIGLTKPINSNEEKYSYKPEGLTISSQGAISNVLLKTNLLTTLGRYSIIIANISLFILLVLRWIESGHFPLSNLYESLMFLSWSFTSLHLLLENTTFLKNTKELEKTGGNINTLSFTQLLGAITTPSALFTNAFATFTLPKEMQEAAPLVPALQSNWLMMHVTVMIISYAALILGSLLAVAYLIITSLPSFKFSVMSFFNKTEERSIKLGEFYLNPTFFGISLYSLSKTLDNLSYRILGIGFPFLTIGILSGAVWANEAWGSYWSWDPKETWALLTWLIFAIYLHTRLNKTEYISNINTEEAILTKINEDKQPAIIATLGFVVVWICYLGVNLIGEGLHSYGWLSQ